SRWIAEYTESIHLPTAGTSFSIDGKREENFLSSDPNALFVGAIEVKAQKQTQEIQKTFFIMDKFFIVIRKSNYSTLQAHRYCNKSCNFGHAKLNTLFLRIL